MAKDDSAHGPVVGGNDKAALNGSKVPPTVDDEHVPTFRLPVDSEHKAKAINLLSFAPPHMRAFHLNWMGFFSTFMSAYAAAPLIPLIRDSVGLEQFQANLAGVVTTALTVFARAFMGGVCDKFGPRYAFAGLLILTAIPILGIALVHNAAGYIISRMLIGCGLATFVVCQYWASIMFSPSVVGMANAIAGGWGNAGGGVTQLAMPALTLDIQRHMSGLIAWRWAFFLPAFIQIILAILILTMCQDLPDGNFANLERSGRKQKAKLGIREITRILTDYRVWGLCACYAYSFGVELSLDNALAPYLQNQFHLTLDHAANLASIFGIMNFVARPVGGVCSDYFGRLYGMRGRIWVLFVVYALGGVFVCLLGVCHESLGLSIAFIVLAGWCLEFTCGTVYGVVPFVSRRSTGLVCGLVSAGGATGGVINQAIFFLNTPAHGAYVIGASDAFKWLGVVIVVVACLGVAPVYFPQWGGMFCPPKAGVTEEDYYFGEYTPLEREQGMHLAASKFAFESRSMRGLKRLAADPMFPASGHKVQDPPAAPPA